MFGFEGIYEVSNLGNVRSVDRDVVRNDGVVQHRSGKMISQRKNDDGYMTVHLSNGSGSKTVATHILVAQAFVDGWFSGAEVNHLDCSRENNLANNLEWVTHAYNVRYAIDRGNHVCTRDLSGANNPNYGKHTLKEKYRENRSLSKAKQGRPGKQNGRARKIRMCSELFSCDFDTIKDCATYMIENRLVRGNSASAISTMISKAAINNRTYRGFMFVFV